MVLGGWPTASLGDPIMMMMMGSDDGDHEDYNGHDHQAPGFNVFGWPVVT